MKYNIVYYFQGNNSEELRYSIRSVEKNLEIDKLILVGDRPAWFKETNKSIYVKSTNLNLQKCGLGSVSILHLKNLYDSGKMPDNFLLFNDDFYIMKKIEKWKDYYRDEKDYNKKAKLNHAYHKKTLRSLQYTENKKKYNLHLPIMIEKQKFLELYKMWLEFRDKDIDFRTLYGNLFINSNTKIEDFKISKSFVYSEINLEKIKNSLFISTSDSSFNVCEIGNYLRSIFDKPSFAEML